MRLFAERVGLEYCSTGSAGQTVKYRLRQADMEAGLSFDGTGELSFLDAAAPIAWTAEDAAFPSHLSINVGNRDPSFEFRGADAEMESPLVVRIRTRYASRSNVLLSSLEIPADSRVEMASELVAGNVEKHLRRKLAAAIPKRFGEATLLSPVMVNRLSTRASPFGPASVYLDHSLLLSGERFAVEQTYSVSFTRRSDEAASSAGSRATE